MVSSMGERQTLLHTSLQRTRNTASSTCESESEVSRVRLFVTPWTVAHQAPSSMGFSREKYLDGLPFPSPGELPNPGIEPGSPTLQADALTAELPENAHLLGPLKQYLIPSKRQILIQEVWGGPESLRSSRASGADAPPSMDHMLQERP